MKIELARRLTGRLRLPGDKSISHRAAIIAALCETGGRSRLTNYATSADCASTLSCLNALGVRTKRDGDTVEIEGAGLHLPHAPAAPLDCGNSGTTMRLLAGVLAGQSFAATLTGDESLRSRPMRRISEPLELMGARLVAADEGGRAPLRIEGRRPLKAMSYALPVASAQVKSCVLLAGLSAEGRTEVIEARGATRDHTERLLSVFGVDIKTELKDYGGRAAVPFVSLNAPARLQAQDCDIAGDISSAAFFLVAGALLAGSDLTLEGVGLNPTRTHILRVLQSLGADIFVGNEREDGNEPRGDLHVRGHGELVPIGAGANVLRGELIAGLIDELPVLAVFGTQIEGGLEIRDAAELRVKETDRITAICKNLRAMGAQVGEYAHGMRVEGRTLLHGARLESYGDHRIAMACTVAALIAKGASELNGAESVTVSFPEFFATLGSVVER